jgi:RNA polymerase sigma-70 factor (ECF subfamily)
MRIAVNAICLALNLRMCVSSATQVVQRNESQHTNTKADNRMHPKGSSGISAAALVELVKTDYVSAFTQVYQVYRREVFGQCLRMTKNVPDSEDLTQEIFVQVYRKLSSFRGEAAFGTWLFTVARNVILMQMRKPSLETIRCDVSELEAATGRAVSGSVDKSMLPLRRLALKRAVSALPAHRRRIFIMHDIHGFSHYELSRHLGIETGTSKSQLHHAHVSLRNEAWQAPQQQA